MLTGDRQGGSRNFVAGLFATFWVLLAVFSCAYLFRIVTEPSSPHADVDAAQASAIATETPAQVAPAADVPPSAASNEGPPPLSADQAQALLDASAAKDQEIGELKTKIEALSQQVTDLNSRLAPIEKVVGPVAALQPGAAVTTSPPQPELPLAAPPEPVKPSSRAAAKAAEKAKAEKAQEPIKPPEPAKTAEPAKAPEPIKPPQTTTPPEQAAEAEAPAPSPAQGKEPAKQAEAKAPERPPETAKPAGKPSEVAAKPQEAAKPQDAAKPQEKPAQVAAISPPESKPGAKAEAPAPSPAPAENAAAPATPPAETANLEPAIPIPPGTTRFGIEIGSVDKQEGLRSLWKELLNNHAALVAGLQARRVLAPDKKWRLVAGPFPDVAEATQACGLFKKANLPCEATVFAGDSL